MVKGVKKIKWSGIGVVKKDLSTPNKKVVIAPDQQVLFEVEKWYEATPETDKKKHITWIFQDPKTKTIVLQKTLPSSNRYGIKIPKNLCGPFEYYLEASLSGKRDAINKTGLLISGHCPAKIVSSKWCITNDGKDVRKEHFFNYGETVYLNLRTEGLNGNLNLSVDIFRKSDDKEPIQRYTSVDVIDGEINLQIKNTLVWHTKLKGIKETEEFYVKVFDPTIKLYIPNDKNETKHASFLKINKKTVPQEIKPPTNMSPLKTGEPDKNAVRFDPCKFETISITEPTKTTLLFNKGKNLRSETNPKKLMLKTVLFDFNKSVLTPEAKTIISNVLQYVLGIQNLRIKIDGHACVIGREEYNQKLSQERSDAVKKAFTDSGLASDRIIAVGHGEVNPTDDKKGRDNIKYKDEEKNKENRRVDITFESYGHDAQTILFETIAPSIKQDVTIDITEYQNTACHKEIGKHTKNIKINSPEYPKPIDKVADKLNFPINSSIDINNPMPLQYIWPRYNLTKIGSAEKSIDSATNYFLDVHSCRYFSNDANHTIHIKAYPDIKWRLEFFINLTNDLSVKWANQSDYKLKELQSKAGKIGAERRWKQKEASIGFSLVAKWNNDKRNEELKHKYDTKFKKLYDVFNSLGALSDGITNKTKGAVRSISPEGLPVSFVVKPPNLSFTGDWFLSNPVDNKLIIGTDLKLTLKAAPLIGLEITIDLLGAAVFVAGDIVSFGTAGPQALKLYKEIQKQLKKGINFGNDKVGVKTSVDIYMDLIITGTIGMTSEFKFNTAGKAKDSVFKLASENKIKVELKVGIKIKGEAVIVIVKASAYFEVAGTGAASITFGHGINYDDKGLYYRPKLGFDGLDITYIVQVSASLAIKIAKDGYKIDEKKEGKHKFAEGEFIGFIPAFDVIKELEDLFDISANIPLIKNN
ncbi:OmpA family protein [Flavobacterium chungangense]|uniref:Peptidoglycan-associated lipoprotein n=1 Tax=Flavobacterium chungangense TaxID=554283 RepID=A0A6V6YUI9_9FLAO|nr:OmpA family protein [Flavobacterium chungangense]CAD0002944.1 Peptidoglycan-associated lipoprotein [Flavobacterium chungangense]